MDDKWIIQCNGERLRLGFLDFTNFLRTLVGRGIYIAIVPMNVLIFLPPTGGGVDTMTKIVLRGVMNVNGMKRDGETAHLSVLVGRDA